MLWLHPKLSLAINEVVHHFDCIPQVFTFTTTLDGIVAIIIPASCMLQQLITSLLVLSMCRPCSAWPGGCDRQKELTPRHAELGKSTEPASRRVACVPMQPDNSRCVWPACAQDNDLCVIISLPGGCVVKCWME
jgi:hypothetical protein